MSEIINYLSKEIDLTDDQKSLIRQSYKRRQFKKRTYIHQPGDIHCNNFIVSGALRLYSLDDNYKEHNLQFGFENWFIGDLDSFMHKKSSNMYLQAMENTTVLQITSDEQSNLLEQIPVLNALFLKKFMNALVQAQSRITQTLSASAEERFINFMDTYPKYMNRIPNSQLASYIGVTPEFFCKMRSRVIRAL